MRTMRIYHKRKFGTAVVATAVSLICLVAYFAVSQESRFVVAFFLTLVYAGIEYRGAFSKNATLDELSRCADERDVFLAMRASRTAMLVLNRLLLVGCIASALLYSILPWPSWLTVTITLCAASIALFAVVMLTNLYYEKRG